MLTISRAMRYTRCGARRGCCWPELHDTRAGNLKCEEAAQKYAPLPAPRQGPVQIDMKATMSSAAGRKHVGVCRFDLLASSTTAFRRRLCCEYRLEATALST